MVIAMNEGCQCVCFFQIFFAMNYIIQVHMLVVNMASVVAVQADGMVVTTIEGMAGTNSDLHPIQQAFQEKHGLQCGFCTPGIIMSVHAMLHENPNPSDEEIRHELSGNICRCTGYQNIVEAVKLAAERLREQQMEVQ